MKFLGLLLRIFSYLFHFLSSLFLLGVAFEATISHQPLNLRMLPFGEDNLLTGTYMLGIFGLLATLLVFVNRAFKYVFPLWAMGTVYALIKGFFFSSYVFNGNEEFQWALLYIFGSILAMIGAFWTLKPRRGRLYA